MAETQYYGSRGKAIENRGSGKKKKEKKGDNGELSSVVFRSSL